MSLRNRVERPQNERGGISNHHQRSTTKNDNRIQQIRIATISAVNGYVVCAGTAAPALAGETHDSGEGEKEKKERQWPMIRAAWKAARTAG